MGTMSGTDRIWSIGHGTRPVDDLIRQLEGAGVERLIDVRTAPGSRRNPQYGRDALTVALAAGGIDYAWRKELGGFRRPATTSPHTAIRNDSFRGYADHMDTEEFQEALGWLQDTARRTPTAFMCAESVWWRCHRRMIADALLVRGWTVVHLMPNGRAQSHVLHPDSRVEDGRVIYVGGV